MDDYSPSFSCYFAQMRNVIFRLRRALTSSSVILHIRKSEKCHEREEKEEPFNNRSHVLSRRGRNGSYTKCSRIYSSSLLFFCCQIGRRASRYSAPCKSKAICPLRETLVSQDPRTIARTMIVVRVHANRTYREKGSRLRFPFFLTPLSYVM